MICVSLEAATTHEALGLMERAFAVADMVELRLDAFRELDLKRLLACPAGPVLVTNRSRREGGRFSGADEERCSFLAGAIDLGAAYVDIDLGTEDRILDALVARARKSGDRTRVILSFHDFEKTPSLDHLRARAAEAFERGAGMVKLATMARAMEDNLTMLRFLVERPQGARPATAFCMGEAGRISRLAAPLFGSAITFAALEKGRETAPGQFTVEETRRLQEMLS